VITPVALDHQRYLGYDIATIATEKAGIISPGSTTVLAAQTFEAGQVVANRAREVGGGLLREGYEFGVAQREVALGGQLLTLQGVGGIYPEIFLPLHGAHQAANAACALAAVEALLLGGQPDFATSGESGGWEATGGLAAEVVRSALAAVESPGRLEVVRRSPTIVVDAAHNPAGAQALVTAVEESFAFSRLVGVCGVLDDKDAEGILGALEPLLDEIVITQSTSGRAVDSETLFTLAQDVFGPDRVHLTHRVDEALDIAVQRAEMDGQPGAGVIVTGSVTVVADVRTLLGAK
jgi:dihydrofolate synthase/folylpolyglutamate synthase